MYHMMMKILHQSLSYYLNKKSAHTGKDRLQERFLKRGTPFRSFHHYRRSTVAIRPIRFRIRI